MSKKDITVRVIKEQKPEDVSEYVNCPICGVAELSDEPWYKPACQHLRFMYILGNGFQFAGRGLKKVAKKVEGGNTRRISTCNNSDCWDTLKADLAGRVRRKKWENWDNVEASEKSEFWDVLKAHLGPGGAILEQTDEHFFLYLGYRAS